ncbi:MULTISPECIES: hypothetical protein [unclassified Pseudoclavibacter]|nr:MULTISPECIES: hypothetical protein [unclassified Pseudoclavibacter]MCD7100565.1 hypothetical protein [Pseudoclavibacter sp. 13-3]
MKFLLREDEDDNNKLIDQPKVRGIVWALTGVLALGVIVILVKSVLA